jgi:nucleotide-binding universal stress UspA family protein
MYRRISVPLDSTPESRHALGMAARIAQKADCVIELVYVVFTPVLGSDPWGGAMLVRDDTTAFEHSAEQSLDSAAKELEALGLHATTVVLRGDISTALADHVRVSGTDLIVMTTHDRGRLESLLLGSAEESVVRHVHVPVLLVRADDETPTLMSATGIKHILVTLDGSEFSEQIMPHVTRLASLMGAEVTVLSVLEPILAAAALASGIGGPPSVALAPVVDSALADDDERRALANSVLEPAAQMLRARNVTVHPEVVVSGNTARAIVDYATHHGVDVIAMTTHGRGALKRLIAGSVSEEVLRMTPTSTLMYRPEQPAET